MFGAVLGGHLAGLGVEHVNKRVVEDVLELVAEGEALPAVRVRPVENNQPAAVRPLGGAGAGGNTRDLRE